MPAPVFTTNDGDISQLEGLYVKERNPPAAIAGVNLSVVGMCGEAVRGPINKVVEIGSEARFLQVFGGRDQGAGGAIVSKLWTALLNKKFGTVFMVRCAAAAAAVASFTAETVADGSGTAVLRVDAANAGTWGNNVKFKVAAATDGDSNHFDLSILYLNTTTTYKNLDIHATGTDNTLAAVGTDDANLIVLTKLANGRPVNTADITGSDSAGYISLGQTISGFTAVAGTDGSIADSDFTAAGKGIDLLTNYSGIGVVMVAERSSATLKTAMATKAATVSDRLFLICPDASSTTQADAITDAASNRSDRVIYCFNHPYTLDPEVAAEVQVSPVSWMASILSQTDVDENPGNYDTLALTAGIIRLTNANLSRADLISLRVAGMAALVADAGGFVFQSGVTTSLTPGREQIDRRRSCDFIQISLADALKFFVKQKNTETRRKTMAGMINTFLGNLKRAERVVEDFVVDGEKLNTDAGRAQGIERILVRVKLIGHILSLVIETEIGTAVTIKEAA